ncbi:arsenate reductase family protein [Verrucomicrobia bacterium]|nr:arsenate reductase family protein [Verrucomicrobiota bacterium]MDA7618091.1 arsenate reductase family protein [Verrucomicrobiota bacterium]
MLNPSQDTDGNEIMKALRIYEYSKCDTCRKAIRYLDAKGKLYERIAIRECPPSKKELEVMLTSLNGERKRMFNTSGADYRAMNIRDKLPSLSDQEVIDLLAANGNLIRRPFLLDGRAGVIGFKPDEWDAFLERLEP